MKVDTLLEELQDRIDQLRTSAGWVDMLRMRRRMHTYSLNNQLLIWLQNPDATMVAGFKRWQELGRQVRKGEHGIRILAPNRYTRENDAGEKVTGIYGFRVVSVFDVAQTDGPPLPELSVPEPRACPAGLYEELRQVAAAGGFDVYAPREIEGTPGAHGWLEPEARRIAIRPAGEPRMAACLLHELGHGFDPELDLRAYRLDHGARSDAELVAESVAHLCSLDLGIDLAGSEVFYLAGWSGEVKELFALTGRITASYKAVRVLLAEQNLLDEEVST